MVRPLCYHMPWEVSHVVAAASDEPGYGPSSLPQSLSTGCASYGAVGKSYAGHALRFQVSGLPHAQAEGINQTCSSRKNQCWRRLEPVGPLLAHPQSLGRKALRPAAAAQRPSRAGRLSGAGRLVRRHELIGARSDQVGAAHLP